MLNLERLRVLRAVASTGSVVGAAAALHVTTSAVSQQLARLEREVGEPVAERNGRGIRLTDAGALLAERAGELLADVERIEAELAERRGTVTGNLRIAAFATAARGLLPGALADLRHRHPELSVTSAEQEPHEAIPAVLRGTLDLAIVQDWADDPLTIPEGLAQHHLLDDRFDLALPADHPLADRTDISVQELADQEWIGWSPGQICHDWLIRTLRKHDIEPNIAHTASEHSTQLALVAAGLGAAVIPRLGREPTPARIRIIPIEGDPTRRVFAVWRAGTSARPAIRAAVTALTTVARQ